MGPDPILAQHLEDQQLAPGKQVVARWHDWRGRFAAQARVVALKPRTVLVELMRPAGAYQTGQRLELPRISDSEHWSNEHGVRLQKAV